MDHLPPRETGATEYAWDANVSGYRVLSNGVVDMDPANIHQWSDPYQQDTPDWLMDLIDRYAPGSW